MLITGEWVSAIVATLVFIITGVGAYWKLNNNKADKEMVMKELKEIDLKLQKLFDKIDSMNTKLDDLKKENDEYKKAQDELKEDVVILKTERDNRKGK